MVIYTIINLINGKRYIGQTIQKSHKRWSHHKFKMGSSPFAIHCAMRKYGIDNFSFEVIDESASDRDELNDLESFYISFYDTFKGGGYNMTSGGESCVVVSGIINRKKLLRGKKHPLYGIPRTEDTKEKIRKAILGKKHNEESIEKMRNVIKSAETIEKIRQANIGRRNSKESIRKMQDASVYSKAIIQLTITGALVKEYCSTSEAVRQTGIGRTNIIRALKKKSGLNFTKGYIWRYKSDFTDEQYQGIISLTE